MTTFGKHTPRETHPIGLDGLLELAALDADGQITYCTPITDDVLGWLTPEEITFTFTIHPGAIISANHRMHWARQEAHWGSDAGGVHAPASLHRTQSPCFI